jgi:hypothetical protein
MKIVFYIVTQFNTIVHCDLLQFFNTSKTLGMLHTKKILEEQVLDMKALTEFRK